MTTLTSTTKRKESVAINTAQFVADYLKMTQHELMSKYSLTSTAMMKLIREHVPPRQRYSARIRSGFAAGILTQSGSNEG